MKLEDRDILVRMWKILYQQLLIQDGLEKSEITLGLEGTKFRPISEQYCIIEDAEGGPSFLLVNVNGIVRSIEGGAL